MGIARPMQPFRHCAFAALTIRAAFIPKSLPSSLGVNFSTAHERFANARPVSGDFFCAVKTRAPSQDGEFAFQIARGIRGDRPGKIAAPDASKHPIAAFPSGTLFLAPDRSGAGTPHIRRALRLALLIRFKRECRTGRVSLAGRDQCSLYFIALSLRSPSGPPSFRKGSTRHWGVDSSTAHGRFAKLRPVSGVSLAD